VGNIAVLSSSSSLATALPPPTSTPRNASERRARIDPWLIACLAAVYLIWSSTYLAMRMVVAELPPLLMASLRYATAGLAMLAIAKQRGAAWPTARQWLRVAPAGALLFVGGNGFVAIAELTVSSGGAAVVCAMMPLWTGVLGVVSGASPSRREWLSLIVGFVGVIVLMGGPSLAGDPLHVVLILLAPVSWSLGSVIARRIARTQPMDTFMSSAMQMLTGGAALAIGALGRGERLPVHASAQAWLALGYLIVFGSLIAFTAYNWLLRNARPVVATSYAYVNPILAVLFGAAVSGEAIGVTTLVANVLIVGAIALALARPRAR
jgi:drug/metabolite transporter (DMT)-like permease